MNIETLLIVLLVWAVAGLLAAIAFGKAIQEPDSSPDEEEPLPSSVGTVKYIRRNKRSSRSEHDHTVRTHGHSA
jgi:hypothetical protein